MTGKLKGGEQGETRPRRVKGSQASVRERRAKDSYKKAHESLGREILKRQAGLLLEKKRLILPVDSLWGGGKTNEMGRVCVS